MLFVLREVPEIEVSKMNFWLDIQIFTWVNFFITLICLWQVLPRLVVHLLECHRDVYTKLPIGVIEQSLAGTKLQYSQKYRKHSETNT